MINFLPHISMNLNIFVSKEHKNTAPPGQTKNKVPSYFQALCFS